MPCSERGTTEVELLRSKLDSLTDLLCLTCKMLDHYEYKNIFFPDLKYWWENHQRCDQEAKIREAQGE